MSIPEARRASLELPPHSYEVLDKTREEPGIGNTINTRGLHVSVGAEETEAAGPTASPLST